MTLSLRGKRRDMFHSRRQYQTYLCRLTSLLPQDFSMAFLLCILSLRQILFLKVKSTQFTQLFLSMLDRFIELFYELFIAPKLRAGIPVIFEDNDSSSHFCCATANPNSSKSLTGLSREARNKPVFFSGWLFVLECWKWQKSARPIMKTKYSVAGFYYYLLCHSYLT